MTTTSTPTPAEQAAAKLISEGLIGLAAAARTLGSYRGGRPVAPSTVTRMITRGVQLANGQTLRLEAVRLHGHYRTSAAAVVRYLAAQAEPVDGPTAPAVRPYAARRAASEVAEAELVAAGC